MSIQCLNHCTRYAVILLKHQSHSDDCTWNKHSDQMHKYSVVVSLVEFSTKGWTQLPLCNVFSVSAILKRMESKQAMCPSDVRQLQGYTILSPKTRGKSDKGTVTILIV